MIDDAELDTILRRSAPRTTAASYGIRSELDELVRTSEADASPRRRRSRIVAAAAIVIASLIGGAVGAQAGGFFRPEPTSGDWSDERAAVHVRIDAPSLAPCVASYMVVPREAGTDQRSRDDWDQVWATATSVLDSVDPAKLQTPAIRKHYRDSLSPESRSQRTEADIWVSSIGAYLNARVASELQRKGLPQDMLLMGEANDCDPDAF